MPELDGLPAIAPADVTNDDFVLIFDNSAATNKSRKATRTDFLKNVAFQGGNHNFGTSEIDTLTATTGTVVDLTVTTSLAFDAAATLQKMYRRTGPIVTAGTGPGTSETLALTVTGAAIADYVNISFSGPLPDGLMVQAWVSAADTVSVKFYNSAGGAIAGASYSTKIVVMRFA